MLTGLFSDFVYRVRALFRKSEVEAEMEDELRFHLEQQARKLQRSGLTPAEAERNARIALGGVEQIKEECRQSWGILLLENVLSDIRYAVRGLRKSPAFTATAILSLALAIGANTAIFTLIEAVILRQLPIRNPESLLVVARQVGSNLEYGFDYKQYRALRENGGAAEIAAYSIAPFGVSVDGGLEPTAQGQLVSGNYFSLLGVDPVAGRAISAGDDHPSARPVAMISHGYWQRRFAGSPSVIGSTIMISGAPFEIVGVAPAPFSGVEVGAAPDIFVPLITQPTVMPSYENLIENPMIFRTWCQTLARLNPGVSTQQAASTLSILVKAATPEPKGLQPEPRTSVVLQSASTGLSGLRQFSFALYVLLAVTGIVLLIACANTGNLLLSRAASRSSEFFMRLSLGASRGRLITQLLAESVVLAAGAGVCGVFLAYAATRVLVVYMSAGRVPYALDTSPNLRVLAFAAGISALTAVLFGIAPALRSSRVSLTSGPRITGRAAHALQPGRLLTIAQVSLSLVLLIAAGLFMQTLRNLARPDSAASRDTVLTVRVQPKGSDQRGVPGATERLDRLYRDLIDRVQVIPGVRVASMAQVTPTTPTTSASAVADLPHGERLRVPMLLIYPRYFEVAGMQLAAGRDFNTHDLLPNAPLVCIVNEAYVRTVYRGENPLGKPCLKARRPRLLDSLGDRQASVEPYPIVGVVKDSRITNPRGETRPVVYTTFLQSGTGRGQMVLHARVAGSTAAVLPRIREEVWSMDKELPLYEVRTLEEEMDAALMQERLIATLSSLFGGLALLLACVGLYGLLAFSVARRTGEMGLRMALGAKRPNVICMILREAFFLVGIGVAIGVPASLAISRIASSRVSGLLFGLQATDPATIAAAVAILAIVGAVSAFVPARRASLVDPMTALRTE